MSEDARTPNSRARGFTVAAVLIAILVVALTAIRIRYGVDFTDEAFYVALPYRFALGDAPFVDELHIIQTTGIVLSPLVSAFLKVSGSAEGIVVFMRACYVVMVVGTGAAVFSFLRRVIPTAQALLAGLVFVAFVPYSLPSLSYNTIACACLVVGTVCVLRRLLLAGPLWLMTLTGLLFGLAVVVYPPGMLLPLLVSMAVVFLAERPEGTAPRAMAAYVAGAAIAACALLVPIVRGGWDAFAGALEYTTSITAASGSASIVARLLAGARSARDLVWTVPVLVLVVIGLYVLDRSGRRLWVLLALPAIVGIAVWEIGLTLQSVPPLLGAGLGAMTMVVWPMVRSNPDASARRVFGIVFPIALAGGIAFAFTSSHRAWNFGLGYAPIVIALAAGLSSSSESLSASSGRQVSDFARGAAAALPLVALVVAGVVLQYGTVYRDDEIGRLDTVVSSGPYVGLMTTSATAELVANLEGDISEVAGPDGRVLSIDRFPAGYLFSTGRPATCLLWTGLRGDRDASHEYVLDYYRRTGIRPDAVIVNLGVRATLLSSSPPPGGPLLEYAVEDLGYVPLVERDEYAVYGSPGR